MHECRKSVIVGTVLLSAIIACRSDASITVYNNFGADHDGWNYYYNLGWTVAGEYVQGQFGVEQAMGFTSTADGFVSDIWVAMFYVPKDPGFDVVTLYLAHRQPGNVPPAPEDIMEEWRITEFETWDQWNPPIHLEGSGTSFLEENKRYWLWAVGGEVTWCGWCMNEDFNLLCPHTLRIEGQDWGHIYQETASAFRVDVASPCPADVNGSGVVDIDDLFDVLSAWGACEDCPEDINDDEMVNIDDVFEVLGNWGPCP
ncbi:MAG: hypothetical protein JSV91_14690 [Phycisphaerales bacterium]|nr:MAG: hypothetical protein JSV91_14690 [Phycisphaerales bacterium]